MEGIYQHADDETTLKVVLEDGRPNGTFATYADVAQLAEQLPCKQQVIGSSPIVSSKKAKHRKHFRPAVFLLEPTCIPFVSRAEE